MSLFKMQAAKEIIPTPTMLFPSATWVGTDDTTGWGGASATEPTASASRTVSDPAKLSLSCAEDFNESFVDDYVMTFFSGSRLGAADIQKVRVYCSGNFIDITDLTMRSRVDWDGVTYKEWGWHATLDHSAFSADGWVRVYATAFPVDPTKAPRTIGPLKVRRKTGSPYDATILVGAGQTHNTTTLGVVTAFNNAVVAAKLLTKPVASGGSGFGHVRIKPVGSLTYDMGDAAAGSAGAAGLCKGCVDIYPDPGNTLLFNKSSDGDVSQFGFDYEGMRFCTGVRLDCQELGVLYAAYDNTNKRRAMSFMGCEIFNSDGKFPTRGMFGYAAEKTPKADRGLHGSVVGMRLAAVNWHDMHIGPKSAQLIRNMKVKDSTQDQLILPDKSNGIQYCHYYNIIIEGFTLSYWDTEIPALRLTFTGSGTLTVEPTGGIDGRNLIWKRNGTTVTGVTAIANSGTVVSNAFVPDASTYSMQGYVDMLNAKAAADATGVGLNGLVAVCLDNTRRAASIGQKAWVSPFTLNSTPRDIVTVFDIHGDVIQGQGANLENINMINIRALPGAGQLRFQDSSSQLDVANINWALSQTGTTGLSRETSDQSHCFHHYDTVLNQPMFMSNGVGLGAYIADAHCSFEQGVYTQLAYENAGTQPVQVRDNILLTGSAPGGSNVSGNVVTGSVASVYVDGVNGNITPQGELLTNKHARLWPFDIDGVARGATTVAGAKVAAAGG